MRRHGTQNNDTQHNYSITSLNIKCRYAECHYAECCFFIVIPSDIKLSVVMLSVDVPRTCLYWVSLQNFQQILD